MNIRSFARGPALVCIFALTVLVALPSGLQAQNSPAVNDQIREALHREIYGLETEKREILRSIVAETPDAEAARWHLGFVKQGDEWVKPSVVEEPATDPRLERYHHRRSISADTAGGHMAVANWCQKHGLPERARAHLSRVIQLEPDHAAAREMLGFVRVGVDWIHRDEIEASRAQQRQQAEDLQQWDSLAVRLITRLGSRSADQREHALKDIAELNRVDQIAILELMLAPHSEAASTAAIKALGNITDDRAMHALIRVAIYSPWQESRIAAADKVGKWPVETFAPMLLSELYMPLETQIETTTDSRGRILYRHSFTREGQDENQQVILDTTYRRVARPGGNRGASLFWAMFQMQGQMVSTQMAAMQQEAFTSEMNRRICDCLAVSTGESLPANPQWWWKWWDEYNEAHLEGEKPTRIAYNSSEVTIVDQTARQSSGGGGASSGTPGGRSDCLVAGTLVWTEAGLKPIETISVGDLVLSQDATSGELAYKPVLRTTVRPSGPLVRIQAGRETIESSGGHLLWVTGEGWIKASDMQSGAALHGVDGSLPIAEVGKLSDQETYNLIVADFHTYFVTESKLLSHDNTVRRPTKAVVPGLEP